MASPRLTTDKPVAWQGRTIRHDDFAASLAVRREELGHPEMPRNVGNRRSLSKQTLLKVLGDLGAKW